VKTLERFFSHQIRSSSFSPRRLCCKF
jgi:hypothetical protein